jgi:catechol 2,3-dioxygenase-like lactoylglutathione lyase family enzyme
MHLEHVNLTVADVERSARFYRDLLGFEERWRGTTTEGRPALHVGTPDSYLALFEGEPGTVGIDYDRVGFNHFGIVVDDLGAAKQRLAVLGVEIHLEADYEPGRRAYFLDPDGYEVELVEYPGE